MSKKQKLLTVKEVAPLLRLRPCGVYGRVAAGTLHSIRVKNRILFAPSVIHAAAAELRKEEMEKAVSMCAFSAWAVENPTGPASRRPVYPHLDFARTCIEIRNAGSTLSDDCKAQLEEMIDKAEQLEAGEHVTLARQWLSGC